MPKGVVRISSEWRQRIRDSGILERVMRHALGEEEMTPTELQAAKIALDRALPVLSAQQINVTPKDPITQLLAEIRGETIEGEVKRVGSH